MFRVPKPQKVSKSTTFYMFFIFRGFEIKYFCVILSRVSQEAHTYCSTFSLESPPRKRKRAKSKNAEVALYSADFSIAFLGLVVSLREDMAELRYFFLTEIVAE